MTCSVLGQGFNDMNIVKVQWSCSLAFTIYHKISLFCGEVVVVVVCCALYEENKSRHVSNIGLQQSLKIHHSGLLLFVVYR